MSQERLKRLQQWLNREKLDAILIEEPINLFYLTGQKLSTGQLIVDRKKARLLVDSRYFESCKKNCPLPVLLADKQESLEELLKSKSWSANKTLAFDATTTTYARAIFLRRRMKKLQIKTVGAAGPVARLRMIKDKEEIALLKKAAKLGSEGFDFLCGALKAGITEREMMNALDAFWKGKGADGFAFDPIIAFGANGSMPHYRAGNAKLKRGDAVLFDIGVSLDGYQSDMTRVVSFGKPSAKVEEIYAIVLEAQEAALAACKSGVKMTDVDEAAREVIKSYGYAKQFPHSLGHGVGLEIHEDPYFRKTEKTVLQPGMVITIEPGIYLEGVGGVRIEDTIVITEKGHDNLTLRPKKFDTIG